MTTTDYDARIAELRELLEPPDEDFSLDCDSCGEAMTVAFGDDPERLCHNCIYEKAREAVALAEGLAGKLDDLISLSRGREVAHERVRSERDAEHNTRKGLEAEIVTELQNHAATIDALDNACKGLKAAKRELSSEKARREGLERLVTVHENVLTVGRLAMRGIPLDLAQKAICILRDAVEDWEREQEEQPPANRETTK